MLHYLNKVLSGKELSAREMEQVLELLTGGDVPHSQIGALLSAMRMRGESISELVGAARMLRRRAAFIDCGTLETVDVVGTGGDGARSFNISTTSAFVAAGAGIAVAKHGNRAVSGKCGAADVLAELGFNLDAEPSTMEYAIQTHGIGFLFAPKMHPVLAAVRVIRRELGVRTIFNLLGPLCNPAGARSIVLGVFDASLTELFAEALRELGAKHAMVVHGLDGIDEISCGAPTRVAELRNGTIKCYDIDPEMLLGVSHPLADIAGGDAPENARILRAVLDGSDRGAARSVVLLNAGATIYVGGKAESMRDGIRLAERAIDSGAALEKLELLIRESQQ